RGQCRAGRGDERAGRCQHGRAGPHGHPRLVMAFRRTRNLILLLATAALLAGCPSSEPDGAGTARGNVSTAGSQPRQVAQSPFSLESHPLPEDVLIGEGMVLTSQPNTFAGNDVTDDP